MKNQNRYTMMLTLSSTILLSGSASCGTAQKPNVIYIFPDQFRNCALSFWNEPGFREKVNFQADPTYTPNLNALAKESVVLTSAQSNCPLSSPHRGMLLSGMYPEQNGVTLNCREDRPISSLKEDITCIGDVYSHAGYECAYFGKLHTDFPTPNDPERPGQFVNDEHPVWDAYTPANRRHGFNFWYSYGTFDEHKHPHYWDNAGKKHVVNEWSPKHETEKVIEYLQNKNKQRDAKKPFFIMLAMNPPHSPYMSLNDCEEEDYNRYKGRSLKELLVRANADTTMKKAACAPYYFAAVTGIDRQIGRLRKALKEMNLDKNTIIVFASDHGETMCSQGTEDAKNSPYREAMNIPFIIHYPGKLKPAVSDLLLSTPDIMPTMLGICGLKNRIPKSVQGKNYANILMSGKGEQPHGALYIQNINGKLNANKQVDDFFPSARGIKTNEYTLALTIDQKKQLKKVLLFNDSQDPYQMNPLNYELPENRQIFLELCRQTGQLLKESNDRWYKERILPDLMKYE